MKFTQLHRSLLCMLMLLFSTSHVMPITQREYLEQRRESDRRWRPVLTVVNTIGDIGMIGILLLMTWKGHTEYINKLEGFILEQLAKSGNIIPDLKILPGASQALFLPSQRLSPEQFSATYSSCLQRLQQQQILRLKGLRENATNFLKLVSAF